MNYIVYILQSKVDNSYYIGFTSDISKRLEYHNSGKSRYTAHKMPWELVYIEEFNVKAEAMKREKFLKAQRNREFYQRLISKRY